MSRKFLSYKGRPFPWKKKEGPEGGTTSLWKRAKSPRAVSPRDDDLVSMEKCTMHPAGSQKCCVLWWPPASCVPPLEQQRSCLITAYGGFGWAENVYVLLTGVWRWVRSAEPCLHLIESDVTTLDLRPQPDAWIGLDFTGPRRWVYFAMGATWIIRQNVVNWYFDGLKWPTAHGIPSLVSPHRRWALPIGCKHTCRQWKHEIYLNIGTFLLEYSLLEPSHHAARKPKLVRWGCQWKREKSHIIPASHEVPSHARKAILNVTSLQIQHGTEMSPTSPSYPNWKIVSTSIIVAILSHLYHNSFYAAICNR